MGEPKKKKATLKLTLPTGEQVESKVGRRGALLGRAPHNDLVVADEGVSGEHALIEFDGEHYRVKDLSGEGGTFLNGERVNAPRLLRDGDVIRLGNSTMVFIRPDPPEREPRAARAKGDGKTKEERVRAAYIRALGGILATVLSVALTVFLATFLSRDKAPVPATGGPVAESQKRRLTDLTTPRPFGGGTYSPSGVAAVPGQNAVLFIDDATPDQVFWMNLNEVGDQAGAIKALPLGATVHNPKGLTQLGSRYIIAGSQGASGQRGGADLAVFTLNVPAQQVASIHTITGLSRYLLENVRELKDRARASRDRGALHIEGIGLDLDPQSPRLLLGLRGPLVNGNALVIPLTILDPTEPWTLQNLRLSAPEAIQVPLEGQGIRALRYDTHLRKYLIISGATDRVKETDFTLWEWEGPGNTSPEVVTQLNSAMIPEGLSRVKIGDRDYLFIISHAGKYTKMEYVEGP
jgi:hypothetical protein